MYQQTTKSIRFDVKYVLARIKHHTAVIFPELFTTGGIIVALYLELPPVFSNIFSWYMVNRLVILGSPGHYILSIHNGVDECNMYDRVLLDMLCHLKMVKLTEISLVTFTTTMAVHALLTKISTMAATWMNVCFIG